VTPAIVVELIYHRRSVNIRNVVLSGIVAAAIALPWYINALGKGLIQKLAYYAWGTGAKPYAPSSSLFDLTALLYYPRIVYTHLVGRLYGTALLAILCLALLLVVTRRAFSSSRFVKSLALSFLVPLLVFTLLEDKGIRFFLPALPCLLVLLIWAGRGIRLRHLRIGPLLLIAVALGGSFLSVVGALQPTIGARFGIYEPWTVSDEYFGYNDYSPPKPHDWKVMEVVEAIAAVDPRADVGILANHWVFNQDTLAYYALRLGFDSLKFRDFRDAQVVPPYDDPDNYDLVLVKTANVGEAWDTNSVRKILERLGNLKDPFYLDHEMVQSLDLPDGSQLLLFVKKDMHASSAQGSGVILSQVRQTYHQLQDPHPPQRSVPTLLEDHFQRTSRPS